MTKQEIVRLTGIDAPESGDNDKALKYSRNMKQILI